VEEEAGAWKGTGRSSADKKRLEHGTGRFSVDKRRLKPGK
jgi:hypothetical protein